jgi:hypothetical protein
VQVQQNGLDVVRVKQQLLGGRLADSLLTQDDVQISVINMEVVVEGRD